MSLSEQQHLFLVDVAKVIRFVEGMHLRCTGGHLWRSPEEQQRLVDEGRSTTMQSKHLSRLAIDFNFFRQDAKGRWILCMKKGILQPIGDYWEELSPYNAWGGNWESFVDLPHFERRPV